MWPGRVTQGCCIATALLRIATGISAHDSVVQEELHWRRLIAGHKYLSMGLFELSYNMVAGF